MLENYPDDPYSDVCVITQTRRLNLVLAYLAIDSMYFSKIDPDTRQINLTHIVQDPLIRVIRSLYGEELIVNTVGQLAELYEVIKFLQIDDYKENIEKEILEKSYVFESIEFLQFSFKAQLLVQQVIKFHIENKLKLLQNNRNYLQLNKISLQTFQTLISAFITSVLQRYENNIQNLLNKPEAQIINHVLQNYFNRNNIKALNYFNGKKNLINQYGQTCFNNNSNLRNQQMQMIWNKFHHIMYFTPTQHNFNTNYSNNSLSSTSQVNQIKNQNYYTIKSPSNISNMNKIKSQKIQTLFNEQIQKQIQEKRKRILYLQNELKEKDLIIEQIQKEIKDFKQGKQRCQTNNGKGGQNFNFNLKKSTNSQNNIILLDDDQDQYTNQQFEQEEDKQKVKILSLKEFQEQFKEQTLTKKTQNNAKKQQEQQQKSLSFLPNIKSKSRKSKQYQQEQDFTVSSVFEPAFNRKIPQLKQIRTMKKVCGNTSPIVNIKKKFLPN